MGFGSGYNRPRFTGRNALTKDGQKAKRILRPEMVAHVWANQAQDIGETAKGNFYFDGPTLYSYGSHYVAGYVTPGGLRLVNADRSSPTTNGHTSSAYQAARPSGQYCPDLTTLRDLVTRVAGIKARLASPSEEYKARPDLMENLRVGLTIYRDKLAAWIESNCEDMTPQLAAELIPMVKPTRDPAKALAGIIAKRRKTLADLAAKAAKEKRAAAIKSGKALVKIPVASVPAFKRDGWQAFAQSLDSAIGHAATRWHGDYRPDLAAKALRPIAAELRAAGLPDLAKHAGRLVHALQRANAATLKQAERQRRRAEDSRQLEAFRTALVAINRAEWAADRVAPLGRLTSAANWLATLAPISTERLRAVARAASEACREAREQVAAEREAKAAAAKSDWLAGKPSQWKGDTETGGVYLRAVDVTRNASGEITGGTLETSRGAEVPLTHAVRVFRFVKRCREAGRAWHANGHTIRAGHFRLDSIDTEGNFTAGCHRIEWAQIEAAAISLGVFELPADDSALEPSGH